MDQPQKLRPVIDACGARPNISAFLPRVGWRSFAPVFRRTTRGRRPGMAAQRADNFLAVEVGRLPNPSAWRIGQWRRRNVCRGIWQEAGRMAACDALLSAWGTANMRHGGDDVAQAIGPDRRRPLWERPAGSRVLRLRP